MPAYFPSLTICGQVFHFAHLEPFTFMFHSERANRQLRVRVTFSNHCFSKAYDPKAQPLVGPIIRDGRQERTFCLVRYRLSFRLRGVIEGLQASGVRVYETATGRNWCYSILVEDPQGPYHVFFEVRRATGGQKQWQELRLVVESAYHQGEQGGPVLRGRMLFTLLCSKVYLQQPTATRR